MSRPRILLVEDEALVSMMMEDLLDDLGCEVAACFAEVDPTLVWLDRAKPQIDGAILDINLGGSMVFPIADALRDRGTPFAFVTGYTNSDQARTYDAPLLTKPVGEDELKAVVGGFAG